MNIGIIGTGNVGTALATGLKTAGHETVLGSRDPESSDVEGLEVVTQRAAAEYGDVVVLALPAGVVVDVASESGMHSPRSRWSTRRTSIRQPVLASLSPNASPTLHRRPG